jgi:hypothetical protein
VEKEVGEDDGKKREVGEGVKEVGGVEAVEGGGKKEEET